MNIIKRSNSGFQTLPLAGTMLAQRRIFLSDAITMETANTVIQQLLFLEAEDPAGEINIYISYPGGEVNAGLMIHSPYISGNVGGNAEAIQRTADSIMETKKTIVRLLGENTGKTREEIERAISFDNTMDATQAVEFGICDEIVRRF